MSSKQEHTSINVKNTKEENSEEYKDINKKCDVIISKIKKKKKCIGENLNG